MKETITVAGEPIGLLMAALRRIRFRESRSGYGLSGQLPGDEAASLIRALDRVGAEIKAPNGQQPSTHSDATAIRADALVLLVRRISAALTDSDHQYG